MPDTTPPNLFAAARSYVLAMSKLLPDFNQGLAHATMAPYFLLGGFAFELAFKAVVLRVNGSQSELRGLGHDLLAAAQRACEAGLSLEGNEIIAGMAERLAPVHKGLVARYVPDVEVINLPQPVDVLATLVTLANLIEDQFDVWCDVGTDAATAHRKVR